MAICLTAAVGNKTQIRISNVTLVHHHLLPSTAIQTQMIAKLFNRRTFLLNFTLQVKINISLEQHYFTMPVVEKALASCKMGYYLCYSMSGMSNYVS